MLFSEYRSTKLLYKLLTKFCTWCEQSCADDSSWPFQRDSQPLRSEGLQTFGISIARAAGIGILEKIDARKGGCIGQCAVEECSTSGCQEETPIASKHRRRAQVYAEPSNRRLGERVQDKAVVSQVIGTEYKRLPGWRFSAKRVAPVCCGCRPWPRKARLGWTECCSSLPIP